MGGTHSAVQPDDSLQGSGAVRPSSSFGVVWKGACSTSCGTIGIGSIGSCWFEWSLLSFASEVPVGFRHTALDACSLQIASSWVAACNP